MQVPTMERRGNCLLLAASTHRLAGDFASAQRNLELARSSDLSERLRRALEVEWSEQQLAAGHGERARAGFSRVLDDFAEPLEPLVQAQMLQRRAAAAVSCESWSSAADDFVQAATILEARGFHADAEAAKLAAAAVLANIDPVSAEHILSEVYRTIPTDGGATTRRGLVGGKVAMQAGDPSRAIKRFDEARQGALDVGDPISYLTATEEASHAAEILGDFETAYARLATAWVSLSDVLGAETAGNMIRPVLMALRDRLGVERFTAAKRQYEERRLVS
ncbi:hypothetical protein [Nitrosomonas ureae]|uniref:hypothetical protein n=1 Tax=Nitrosomonas ureae TaxID=44577 RepID=UPI0011601B63|nr:hypothetical protein [Nitrosomonas ureae]